MASELYQEKASSKQLYLDPRTKILLCLSVSTTLIAGNGTGYLLYLHYALAVLPLIFLLFLVFIFGSCYTINTSREKSLPWFDEAQSPRDLIHEGFEFVGITF